MLALQKLVEQVVLPSQDEALFPWWLALLVEPNHEERSAKWLIKHEVNIFWPHFVRKIHCRGKAHRAGFQAVMPGLLFVPTETLLLDRLEEMFDYAHCRGWICYQFTKAPGLLSKADIDVIREIEAKLNLPPKNGPQFKLNQRVRFTNALYAAFWGTGIVFEVASPSRIGVMVEKVIGGPTKVFVPAAEIEAM